LTSAGFLFLWLRFGLSLPPSALMPGGGGMAAAAPPPPPPSEAREEATEAPLPRDETAEAPARDLGGLCVVWCVGCDKVSDRGAIHNVINQF
jgi:hypothetical protein